MVRDEPSEHRAKARLEDRGGHGVGGLVPIKRRYYESLEVVKVLSSVLVMALTVATGESLYFLAGLECNSQIGIERAPTIHFLGDQHCWIPFQYDWPPNVASGRDLGKNGALRAPKIDGEANSEQGIDCGFCGMLGHDPDPSLEKIASMWYWNRAAQHGQAILA